MTCLGEGISPQGIYLCWTKLRTCAGLPFWGYQSSIPKLGFWKVAYEHPQESVYSCLQLFLAAGKCNLHMDAENLILCSFLFQFYCNSPTSNTGEVSKILVCSGKKHWNKKLKVSKLKISNSSNPYGSMYGFPWKTGIFTLHLPKMYGFSYHLSHGFLRHHRGTDREQTATGSQCKASRPSPRVPPSLREFEGRVII